MIFILLDAARGFETGTKAIGLKAFVGCRKSHAPVAWPDSLRLVIHQALLVVT